MKTHERVFMREEAELRFPTHLPYRRISETLPPVKFSITWVNRGQWQKNKQPSLGDCSTAHSLHTNMRPLTRADTRCQPIWLPVRQSHPPRQVPFIASNHFLRHVRYGDINKCTMTVLMEASSDPASANLPAGHFCKTGGRNSGNKQVWVKNSSPLPD